MNSIWRACYIYAQWEQSCVKTSEYSRFTVRTPSNRALAAHQKTDGSDIIVAEAERDSSLVLMGYRALRRGIVRGDYAPAMRLRLDALQQSLSLSSSPLREALNRLVAEGLVQVEEGKGFRVAAISIPEFRELTYLRLLLESDALRRSVQHGDDEWEGRVVSGFHKLRRIEDREPEPGASDADITDEWSARHRQFHIALLSGCGYPRLTEMCATLFDRAERYRRVALRSTQPRRKSLEHNKLEQAVLNRDADKAVELLTAHINKTAERVAAVLHEASLAE